MAEEQWDHMWQLHSEGGDPGSEWWTCTGCSARGPRRNPHESSSWGELWTEVARHMVEVKQLPPHLADENPVGGYSAVPPQNPLWASKADETVEKRRTARRYFSIPAPPGDGTAAAYDAEMKRIRTSRVSVRGVEGVRFTTHAGLRTREERDLRQVQAALAPNDMYPSSDTTGPHLAVLGERVILWVPAHLERDAATHLEQLGYDISAADPAQ